MAWILPIGFEDPGGGWTNEELAFDGDVGTNAKTPPITSREWSGWLIFIFARTVTDKLRLYLNHPGASFDYQLDVYDGATWDNVADAVTVGGPDWFETTFDRQAVIRARYRWRHYGAYWSGGGVGEVLLELTCRGPLVDVCGFFGGVGTFFTDLAADIRDVWVVGEYLATPFENLADLFHDASELCCQASAALQDILAALEGGLTADEIIELLEEYWPALAAFLDDPVVYITEIVSDLIPELPDWLSDPVAWLTDMLELHFPILYYLAIDPVGEILYLIGWAFDLEPYEAQSGEFIVKALFERYFPELYLFARDPERWLRDRVEALIAEFAEDVGAFLDNAWGWLLDQYEDAFESIQARLYVLAEHTLRFFWEGKW